MPTKVVMPQMGESITEGTIVRWLKEVGEQVEKDEPLLEISTDKVDAEVPSPASGTLLKILHQDGDTVAVEEVIGLIGAEGEEAGGGEDEGEEKPAEGKPSKKKAGAEPAAAGGAGEEEEKPEKKAQGAKAPPKEPDEKRPRSSEKPPRNAEGEEPAKTAEKEEGEEEQESEEAAALRRRSSPVVRRIAAEHDIDLAEVEGTGIHGRVTKSDILDFIEEGKKAAPERPAPPAPSRAPGRRAAQPARAAGPHPGPSYAIGASRSREMSCVRASPSCARRLPSTWWSRSAPRRTSTRSSRWT
jgi:pyruvate dehydrogenase E2 component (dihydrolipoamide acetyltransferase)